MFWREIDWVEFLVSMFFLVFVVWLMVLGGALFRASSACLEAGYPEAKVTWKLDSYCLTIDGAVTARVDKLP